MDKKQILKLLESSESETVEFKLSFDKEAVETAAAFANTKGGIVFIGVSDNGKVQGVQAGKKTLAGYTNKISQSTEPTIIPEIETAEIDGKTVVAILVDEFPVKPVAARGRCYRRTNNSNRQMTPNEIAQMHLHSTGTSWDAFPAGDKTLDDIDTGKVDKYIRKANATGRRKIADGSAEVLKKLEFIKDEKATWAAVLVFGKEPQRPLLQSAAHCGRFRIDKTQIIDDLMVETDLIDQVDEVMKFVTRHISVRYEFDGKPRRKEVWEYPLEALREAVTNAIVHRDYTAPSNVQVEIYDDRIDIWNPGELLPGITIADLYKKVHKSVVRNRLVAQAFYDIGYIEKYGSGTVKIMDLCKQHGLPLPKFEEVFGGFSVIFRKDIYTEEYLRGLELSERQIKAVVYVKEKGSISLSSFKTLITGVSEKTLYRDLQDLVSKKILREMGEKKGRKYELG